MIDGEPSVCANTTNQDLGRKINNRINLRMGPQQTGKMWVVCECTNSDCEELIQVTAEQYRQIRKGDSCFIVVVGHESPGEHIVARDGSWLTVQKRGEAKRYAEKMDTP